jgi:hypothetical protein
MTLLNRGRSANLVFSARERSISISTPLVLAQRVSSLESTPFRGGKSSFRWGLSHIFEQLIICLMQGCTYYLLPVMNASKLRRQVRIDVFQLERCGSVADHAIRREEHQRQCTFWNTRKQFHVRLLSLLSMLHAIRTLSFP